MKRSELEAAIVRLIDAERGAIKLEADASKTGEFIVARREVWDARADLDALLDVLDFELAFQAELAITA